MMNTLITIAYIALLLVLGVIAIVGIFGTPFDNSVSWGLDLIISEAMGFCAAYGIYWLIFLLPREMSDDNDI